jgi:hypothetical protein
VGVKYYFGDKSPNEGERMEYGYSKAWLHHKGRNKHHFEYWTDYNPKERRVMAVKMPLKYCIEMFCDRVAASKTYQGEKYTNNQAHCLCRLCVRNHLIYSRFRVINTVPQGKTPQNIQKREDIP